MAGLGKGLSSLISEETMNSVKNTGGYIPNLPISKIVANPYQPRVEFNPEKLVELADSIREHGVIEPLLVTKQASGSYELIAGERRWRAAQLAGIEHVPVVIRESSPLEMLELAVIENIQREDLNPLEEAMAFDQLAKVFNLTHEEIAKKVGVSRPAIANKIRLLGLPEEIRRGLLEGKVSEGHARALLGLDSEDKIIATYKVILRDHLSVRALEELVRRLNKGVTKQPKKNNRIVDNETIEIEKNLQKILGTSVSISRSQKGGKITIPFKDDNQLHQIMGQIQQ
jgi:ParB family transcriptional regulator, chromosome partitioning protein